MVFNEEQISVFDQEETVRKQALLSIALTMAVMVLFAAGTVLSAEPPAGTASVAKASDTASVPLKPGQKMVMLYVSKMTCNGCVDQINKTLTSVNGVDKVEVNLKEGTAQVIYDPTKVQPEALAAAVTKAGYPASLTSDKKTATAKAGCDPSACGLKKTCGSQTCTHKAASDSIEKGATCDPKTKTCTPNK